MKFVLMLMCFGVFFEMLWNEKRLKRGKNPFRTITEDVCICPLTHNIVNMQTVFAAPLLCY